MVTIRAALKMADCIVFKDKIRTFIDVHSSYQVEKFVQAWHNEALIGHGITSTQWATQRNTTMAEGHIIISHCCGCLYRDNDMCNQIYNIRRKRWRPQATVLTQCSLYFLRHISWTNIILFISLFINVLISCFVEEDFFYVLPVVWAIWDFRVFVIVHHAQSRAETCGTKIFDKNLGSYS